ncbi:hypothetical protein EV360DRAFT_88069 [Lentinula raphanica]|nr:hypothetical protein EV360DRAFT_88069 [Lentinula raphanica]
MSLHNASTDRRSAHLRRAGAVTNAQGDGNGDNGDSGSNTGDSTGNSTGTGNGNGNGSSQASSSATTSPSAPAESNTVASTGADSQSASQSTTAAATSQSSSPDTSAVVAQDSTSSSSSSATLSNASTSSATTSAPTSSTALSTSSQTSRSSATSSSQSSTSVSTSTSTHFSTVTPTAGLATGVQASSFASVSHVSTSSSASAASATSSAKVSGAINTGAVVGGIAGGLAAVSIIGFLVAFFLRRYNRRKRAARFEAAQFRRSAMVLDDDPGFMPRPPEMVQNRENNYISSITSTTGPGMAGAGAYRFQQEHQDVNQGHGTSFDTEHEYYRDQVAQQYYDDTPPVPAVPMQRAPLQPRQQYTFGQAPVGTGQASTENANPFVVDNYDGESAAAAGYGPQSHAVGGQYDYQYGNYAAYSPQQTQHVAGAHLSGQQVTRASIIDERDAYGGI